MQKNRAVYLIGIISSLCVWSVCDTIFEKNCDEELIIYPDKAINIVYINNENLYVSANDSSQYLKRITENIIRDKNIKQIHTIGKDTATDRHIIIHSPFIKVANKELVLFTEKEMRYKKSNNPILTDYALIGGKYRGTLTEISKIALPKEIILHNTVPGYLRDIIKKECDSAAIPYYDMYERGAFRIDFKNQ